MRPLMQKKSLVIVLFLSASSTIGMEKETSNTRITNNYSSKPQNVSHQEDTQQAIAQRYKEINTFDPKTQESENTLLKQYIEEFSYRVWLLDSTIPGNMVGPLHIAARSDWDTKILKRCASILLSHNISITKCDQTHQTPLMIACRYRAVENTRLLTELSNPHEIDAADNQFRTALHHACSPTLDSIDPGEISRRFTCTELLLKKGANPNVADNNNLSPLCYLATTFFGSFTASPSESDISSSQDYERFLAQRKALISLLIRHGANKNYTLNGLETKINQNSSLTYLQEFKEHTQLPMQNHDCNLN